MKNANKSENFENIYDDDNIPQVDLPNGGRNEGNISVSNSSNCKDISVGNSSHSAYTTEPVEPLPESTRPRKDGPGGA